MTTQAPVTWGGQPDVQTITASARPGTGSPWEDPTAWDTVYIAGTPYGLGAASDNALLRGSKVRIEGAMRKYKLEVKNPQGADGAITTYRGVRLSPFHIIFFIYSDDQYTYFTTEILPLLKFSGIKNAPNPSSVQSLAIYHPILANLDINAILVEEIGGIDPKEDGPNMFECKVRVVEYLPPPNENTTVTPDGALGTTVSTTVGVQPTGAAQKAPTVVEGVTLNVAGSAPGQ